MILKKEGVNLLAFGACHSNAQKLLPDEEASREDERRHKSRRRSKQRGGEAASHVSSAHHDYVRVNKSAPQLFYHGAPARRFMSPRSLVRGYSGVTAAPPPPLPLLLPLPTFPLPLPTFPFPPSRYLLSGRLCIALPWWWVLPVNHWQVLTGELRTVSLS